MIPVAKSLRISAAVTMGALLATAIAPKAITPKATAGQPTVGTVQRLNVGDRACYVDVLDAGGVYSTEFADFEICSQNLVGKDVELTYELGDIMAVSCEGDPECGEIETVMLITRATVIEPPTIGTVQSVIVGDRACEIGFTNAEEELWYRPAIFEVCDETLVDQTVQFTYEIREVSAYACQGDPACPESIVETLITDVEVLAAAGPDPINQGPIQSLPDGNYRYWSSTPRTAIVSDETIIAEGGTLFRFRKQGNTITGIFSYVSAEAICVRGQVNGNTVSGAAVQTDQVASVISPGESFANFGSSSALALRRGRQVSRSQVRYGSALLNLNGFNRINAGTVIPPGGC
ncbi:MAG: hypothetical protein AAGJ95_17400 [Cyanobacteria bacterium J06554_11]